jgi:hypothetical protein
MSSQAPRAPAATVQPQQNEIKIVSHSNLFYWWPVWAVGLVMGVLTWADGHRMAIVPPKTEVLRNATAKGERPSGDTTEVKGRDVLYTPEGAHLPTFDDPHFHVATNKGYAVLYAIILLLVIVITNVPLRGLWSVVVIITIIMLSIIFQLAGWWEHILDALARLHIYINAGGYFMISLGLLGIWLVTFLFFDPQIYMLFTPKQLRVRQEIGGGEVAYDTTGMVIQKQRNDLFRHWVLGLGSGDLIVNTSGAAAHHFEMPNVLFVGYKLRQIEQMLREVELAP